MNPIVRPGMAKPATKGGTAAPGRSQSGNGPANGNGENRPALALVGQTNDKGQIFSHIRQKWLAETSEEHVRQGYVVTLHNLEDDSTMVIPLAELHAHIHHFAFIPGYKRHKLESEDPINIKAVQIMGDLHDVLEAGGYSGHELERLLVRILFCLFAEDTGIFVRNAFQLYLENHTKDDGSDLGPMLAHLFQDLYDPLSMPANLAKAHAKLDRAVDRCYRSQPFPNERNRIEYLFKLYQKLTTPLLPAKKRR